MPKIIILFDMKKFLETLLKLLIPVLIPVIQKIITDELDKLKRKAEEIEIKQDGSASY